VLSSLNKKLPENIAVSTSKSQIPTELLLSLATGPLLLGVLSLEAVFSWLQATGISSEEVFRGDRLPVLPFPDLEQED
jgi:hypothetical protein